jgi:hypothetical protein
MLIVRAAVLAGGTGFILTPRHWLARIRSAVLGSWTAATSSGWLADGGGQAARLRRQSCWSFWSGLRRRGLRLSRYTRPD